jgi:hypothetical protein
VRWPLNDFWISQGYNAGHQANDLAANQGVPIYAPEAGVVTAVNNNPASYFGGNYVKMRGDSGYVYYMGHNSKNYVSAGNRVTEGQHIADVGMTGEATGPHIHFQMESAGKLLDPSKILTAKATTSKGGDDMRKMSQDELIWNYRLIAGVDPSPGELANYAKSDRDYATVNEDMKQYFANHGQGYNEYKVRVEKEIQDLKAQLADAKKQTASASPSDADKKLQTIKDALGIK